MIRHADTSPPDDKNRALQEELNGSAEMIRVCDGLLGRKAPGEKDYCWYACMSLLAAMRDALQAVRSSVETVPDRPFPIIILSRAIYEASLQFLYIVKPDDAAERRRRGFMFIRFEAWQTVQSVKSGPGGIPGCQASLSGQAQKYFARRQEVTAEIEKELTPDQLRQFKRGPWNVTWTGLSFRKLADEVLDKDTNGHEAWYSIMSMAAHVNPGMIHWCYKHPGTPRNELADHEVRCRKNVLSMLHKCNGTLLSVLVGLADRYELREEKTRIDGILKKWRTRNDEQIVMSLRDDELVRDLVKRITQAAKPTRVILFGSAVTMERGAQHDLDVLVVLADKVDVWATEKDIHKHLRGFPMPVDLVVVHEDDVDSYRNVPNNVIHSAIDEGEVIYDASEAR